jgi:hypothetical protein
MHDIKDALIALFGTITGIFLKGVQMDAFIHD